MTARENNHPDPWHGIARASYVAEVDAVADRVPELSDDELLVEITRLAAMPTWSGRDGHGGIYPWGEGTFGTHLYPLRLWHFSDGVFVTDALPPYDDLVGARIIGINDHDVGEILAAVGPLVPRDNEQQLLSHGPRLILIAEVLHGLGFVDDPLAAVDITVSRDGSSVQPVEVDPVPMQEYEGWAGGHHSMSPPARPLGPPWIRQLSDEIWWEYQPETRTAYVQYNFVGSGVSAVAKEVGARLAQGDVDRIVVDVRHNPGGDNTTYGPLLTFLRSPEVNQAGRLYVIMGRRRSRRRAISSPRSTAAPRPSWSARTSARARISTATPSRSSSSILGWSFGWHRATSRRATPAMCGSRSSRTSPCH